MAVFTLLPDYDFTISDLTDLLEHVMFDSSLSSFGNEKFDGHGFYSPLSLPSSFVALGTGFELGLIDGETYITSGVLDSVSFQVGINTVTWTDLNIQMADFSQAIYEDENGIDPLAVENFLFSLNWEMNLSNQNDTAPLGSTFGDGAPFNPQGDDTINALDGNDTIYSGHGNDIVSGGQGNDDLNGGLGDDLLIGGIGHDRLIGSSGNDILRGFSGRDLMIGGRHDDTYTGGLGSDIFVFRSNDGSNTITDFDALDDREVISLRGVSGISDWADLSDPANGYLTWLANPSGYMAVEIRDYAGLVIRLEGVHIDDLDANDFIF